jgi:phosphatidylserine/phosphatidylglycerophosphate/cardiolipin synthase-like enzyme
MSKNGKGFTDWLKSIFNDKDEDRDNIIYIIGVLAVGGVVALAVYYFTIGRNVPTPPTPSPSPLPSPSPTPSPPPPTPSSQIALYSDRALYPVLVNYLDKAQNFIKIHSYLLELTNNSSLPGAYAVSQALKRAKQRGVTIQLYFSNDGGTRPWHSTTVQFIQNDLGLPDLTNTTNRDVNASGYVIKTGIHAKNVIIDNIYVQAGSANINNNGLYVNLEDTVVYINPDSTVYNKFLQYHNSAWYNNALPTITLDTTTTRMVDVSVSSNTTNNGLWKTFIDAVNSSSTQRVFVSSYNSVTSSGQNATVDTAINALINAKRRGVDVRVVVDKLHNTASYLYNTLTSNQVPAKKVQSPYGGIDHSKLWIVDNIVFISSQNWDSSGNGNFGYVIRNADFANIAWQRANYLWSLG